MPFVSEKQVIEVVSSALNKASNAIDRAQQQLIEEQRGFARKLLTLVGKIESDVSELRARVEALERQGK